MTIKNHQTIEIKRGDTLSLAGPVRGLPDGVWAIASSVRDSSDALVANLTAGISGSAAAGFVVTLEGSTSAWPLGFLYCDVRLTDADGNVKRSQTFMINVVQAVTRA